MLRGIVAGLLLLLLLALATTPTARAMATRRGAPPLPPEPLVEEAAIGLAPGPGASSFQASPAGRVRAHA